MDLQKLLQQFKKDEKSMDDVLEILRNLPFEDFQTSKYDLHRSLRNGFSEVIFCDRKEEPHLEGIIRALHEKKRNIFGTRLVPSVAQKLSLVFPEMNYDPISRTFLLLHQPVPVLQGTLTIFSAGTADIPVAEEALRTAKFFGVEAARCYDVGVAGLPRLLSEIEKHRETDVAIVVAGMEGALPSVVGGLMAKPLIAVPTSVGYGANFGGIAALLGMLNSCAEGISVVNIDNGFGATCAALRILRSRQKNSST